MSRPHTKSRQRSSEVMRQAAKLVPVSSLFCRPSSQIITSFGAGQHKRKGARKLNVPPISERFCQLPTDRLIQLRRFERLLQVCDAAEFASLGPGKFVLRPRHEYDGEHEAAGCQMTAQLSA